MQVHFFVALGALLVLGLVNSYTDECSQYPTCQTCLSVNGSDSRPYCGWCHSDINYEDGTIGKQCADIRDKPWTCPSLYDTYQCTAGYSCNYTSGQCYQAPAGSGFATNASCQLHCFPTPQTYLCDTSKYQCIPCISGDPRCQDKSTACAKCQAPPGQYKCNKTATVPQCEYCVQNDSSCSDFKTACSDCVPHPPPPPPPPPANQTYYTCNNVTLQCIESKTGQTKAGCDAQCSNSTPSALVATWRGIEIQAGFVFGEWDYNFTENTALIKDPDNNVFHVKVSQAGSFSFLFVDGPHAGQHLNGIMADLNTGPETESIAVAFGDWDAPAPASIRDAMNGTNGQRVHVLSRCNSWKTSCNFSSVFSDVLLRNRLALKHQKVVPRPYPIAFTPTPVSHPPDPCNQFTTCKQCIAQRQGEFTCGWCMGGTIVYNDTGDSGLHCAGFIDGQPRAFYCPASFQTKDCQGYSCNNTLAQPQCFLTDDGEYSDKDTCEKTCKDIEYAKCNLETKQCEPCARGSSGCETKDECTASCALQHARCNYTTKQCFPCDPLSDPLCHDSQGECSTKCAQTSYGICNPTTGTCETCDPSKGQPGCVSSCNSTCKAGLQFACNQTTQQCYPGGNMTLNDCAAMCIQNTTDTYGCDYSNATAPQCIQGKGFLPKSLCLDECKAPSYARCDTQTGKCIPCKITEPDCQFTQDYCNASCHASQYGGTYRGIQISKDFKRGEWDFTFFGDNTVAFAFRSAIPQKYEASVSQQGIATQGSPITLTVVTLPVENPLNLKLGDVLTGLYVSSNGEEAITQFLYLGLGLPQAPSGTFDDAMSKLEFVLVGCRDKTTCDFSRANLPE